ncbi:(Fe-S)-binding protein [Agarivorans sp. Z349TD_8]|uniref:(Fe-S)-binding protein n=1 Tax=Agarivorans sp. Z349TD_8 TaxID=3421434 RepID=UPI003D7E0839
MDNKLDWSAFAEQGMGDAYAGIPKQGGDFAKAVAVCIGSGHCERNQRGVMCPSFRITQDPEQSPGGRVRLLKQYLNRDLACEPEPQLMAALDQSMDSCVACKGCKRECESNLDMAQIKAEYLAQKLVQQPLSRRDWLFAHLPQLLYRHRWLGKLIGLRNRAAYLAKLSDHWLGISARIALPELATRRFAPEKRVYYPYQSLSDRPPRSVVLWIDPFTALFHPKQADDALHVLRSAGYVVWLVHPESQADRVLDSGRTLFSKGLIDSARQQASYLLEALAVHVHFERPIIGLEPSSLLMLRDEFLTLGLGEAAEKTAKKALLFEEFLARESQMADFALKLVAEPQSKPLLVHGHCHQKAVGAMKSMRRVLRLVAGLQFKMIESTCCGMAGTFGLESEHIDQAHAMAAQGLLPALAQQTEATIISNGFGCAYQIEQLSGRKPLHLASFLASLIKRPR